VLILLGFAATDFVITMTLSAADATKHAIENPYLHPFLGEAQVGVTLMLLALLAVVFLFGFREAIAMSAVVAIPYLLLSLVVLVRGLGEIAARPELWSDWHRTLVARRDWGGIAAAALLVFPKLALGMSGFETGVSVMPLIDGGPSDARPGSDAADVSLPALRRGGDRAPRLRHPLALLGVDCRGRRAAADPPPVGLSAPGRPGVHPGHGRAVGGVERDQGPMAAARRVP
jgi:hypothetical protein